MDLQSAGGSAVSVVAGGSAVSAAGDDMVRMLNAFFRDAAEILGAHEIPSRFAAKKSSFFFASTDSGKESSASREPDPTDVSLVWVWAGETEPPAPIWWECGSPLKKPSLLTLNSISEKAGSWFSMVIRLRTIGGCSRTTDAQRRAIPVAGFTLRIGGVNGTDAQKGRDAGAIPLRECILSSGIPKNSVPASITIIYMAPAKALRGGDGARNTNKPKGEVETTSNRKPLSRPGGFRPARQGLTIHRKRALAGDQK